MSDITDQIRRFRAGEISREQLVRDLGSRTYAIPSYKKDWPADHYEQLVRIEERDIFEEGTFGEVRDAHHSGLLPLDVYADILRVRERRANRPKPPASFP